MPIPTWALASPLVAMVTSESTKSTSFSGKGTGSHLSTFGAQWTSDSGAVLLGRYQFFKVAHGNRGRKR